VGVEVHDRLPSPGRRQRVRPRVPASPRRSGHVQASTRRAIRSIARARPVAGSMSICAALKMTGPIWSVIGFDPKTVLPRFINALPTRFEVGDGPVVFNAAQIDIDPATGRAMAIERIARLVDG
jgi:hypothetical protein